MLNDPLKNLLDKRRDKREAKGRRPPEPPRPEGVALYRCVKFIPAEAPGSEYDETVLHKVCGRTIEAKPYAPKPRCHGDSMVIVGYDWTRDVE